MGESTAPPSGPKRPERARVQDGWLTGLTLKGMSLIALLCLINAARRTSRSLDLEPSLGSLPAFVVDWLVNTVQATALGLIVAVPVAIAVVVAYNRVPRRPSLRYPALAVAVVASCIAGVTLMMAVEAWTGWAYVEDQSRLDPVIVAMVRYSLLCALVAAIFVFLRAADESAARAEEAERDRARFVQRMEEARLKMLQAQIEPHFLFNTLANVRGLYGTSLPDAERMLDNVMRYLAAALPQMRAADSTLAREAALTTAYLEIQRIRMGRRLAFEVEIPEALRSVPFPPLMLLTLVENAIKHGLAPLPEGGTVRVSAAMSKVDELQLRIADSGRGFVRTSGKGTGLANVRARLAAMYGASGRLTLARNMPQGVVATITVPLATRPAVANVQ